MKQISWMNSCLVISSVVPMSLSLLYRGLKLPLPVPFFWSVVLEFLEIFPVRFPHIVEIRAQGLGTLWNFGQRLAGLDRTLFGQLGRHLRPTEGIWDLVDVGIRDHPFWPNRVIQKGDAFEGPQVRFDWRNPFWHPEKVAKKRREIRDKLGIEIENEVFQWPAELRSEVMMRDEVLPEDLADRLIDVRQARRTALWTYAVLQQSGHGESLLFEFHHFC